MEREYSDEIRVGHAAELLADADLLLKGMRERENPMTIAYLLVIFTLFDTGLTLFAFSLGGVELNPLYHTLSPAAFWMVKLTASAIVLPIWAWVVNICQREGTPFDVAYICMRLSSIGLMAAVLWNSLQLLVYSWSI